MSSIHTVLAVYVVQQLFFALLWLLLARLSMAPRAAAHWGWGSVALAAAVGAVFLRPSMHPVAAALLPNLLNLVGVALVARGLRLFVRAPLRDARAAATVGLAAAVLLVAAPSEDHRGWMVAATAAAMTVLLVAATRHSLPRLRAEFGARAALVCSLPLWLVCVALVARGAVALGGDAVPIESGTALQVVLAFLFVALAMALHFAIGAMLVLRLVNKLRHLSQHDALTGALNRRAYEQRLQAERARLKRGAPPLALLSLDIDHFKRVNDDHGHAAGDALLVAVAALLRREARETDSVARVGGEEFAILLPGTDAAGAERLAQRLLQALRGCRLAHQGAELSVTASIGIAVAEGGESTEALLRRLDRALYAAKHAGRDRAVAATPA